MLSDRRALQPVTRPQKGHQCGAATARERKRRPDSGRRMRARTRRSAATRSPNRWRLGTPEPYADCVPPDRARNGWVSREARMGTTGTGAERGPTRAEVTPSRAPCLRTIIRRSTRCRRPATGIPAGRLPAPASRDEAFWFTVGEQGQHRGMSRKSSARRTRRVGEGRVEQQRTVSSAISRASP